MQNMHPHSLLKVVTTFPAQLSLGPSGPTDATLTSYKVPRLRSVMVYEVVLEPTKQVEKNTNPLLLYCTE